MYDYHIAVSIKTLAGAYVCTCERMRVGEMPVHIRVDSFVCLVLLTPIFVSPRVRFSVFARSTAEAPGPFPDTTCYVSRNYILSFSSFFLVFFHFSL